MLIFSLLSVFCIVFVNSQNIETGELFHWNYLQYENPPRSPTYQVLGHDYYINKNNIPTGLSPSQNKLFITIPRTNYGIPSTVNYIDLRTVGDNKSPMIKAYPDYLTNEIHDPATADATRIVSVYRSRVDECNRLWFVDTGVLEYTPNSIRVQNPSIWVINLRNDKLIRRYEIPDAFITNSPEGFESITIDTDRLRCDEAFAYIPNTKSNQILVYSMKNNEVWIFNDITFNSNPALNMFTVNGNQYQIDKGIYSLALGSRNILERNRKVYYHPFTSFDEYNVLNTVLKSKEASLRTNNGIDFAYIGTRGDLTQSGIHDYDSKTKALFFTQANGQTLLCWNTVKPLAPQNIAKISHNPLLTSQTDLKIDRSGYIWYMSNNSPVIQNSQLDITHPNIFIFKQITKIIIEGTICQENFTPQTNFPVPAVAKDSGIESIDETEQNDENEEIELK